MYTQLYQVAYAGNTEFAFLFAIVIFRSWVWRWSISCYRLIERSVHNCIILSAVQEVSVEVALLKSRHWYKVVGNQALNFCHPVCAICFTLLPGAS